MKNDNALVWTPRLGDHVESHFLKANSADGKRALWIKHTVLARGSQASDAVSEVWAVAFDRDDSRFPLGAKITHPIARMQAVAQPFRIETPEALFELKTYRGDLQQASHRIAWDLTATPLADSFRPFPRAFMYDGAFPRSKTLTPIPDARFSGEFVVDGERWPIEDWPGMQGHNWGSRHTDTYAWAHGNAWSGTDGPAWFEAVAARLRVGPVRAPWMILAAVHVDGEIVRFDAPRVMASRTIRVDTHSLRFRLERPDASLVGEIVASAHHMAGLAYENPDRSVVNCLNSKLAVGRLVFQRAGRGTAELVSDKVALEIGTRDRDHGVRMIL